ncbi:unnamed protein product [Peniophora sp. CBMAI 1063]|nr:unnamed protein product [Peniophora sp. CBMAI 1063]
MHESVDAFGLILPEHDPSSEDDDEDLKPRIPHLGNIPGAASQSATILQRAGIMISDSAIQEHIASGRGQDALACQLPFRVPDLQDMRKFMEKLRKLRRPQPAAVKSRGRRKSPSLSDRDPIVGIGKMYGSTKPHLVESDRDSDSDAMDVDPQPRTVLQRIVKKFHMEDNPEQQLVMKIFDDHHERGMWRDEQLLMYIAGVGGTGKSHVIQAMTTYLGMQDHGEWLLIAAPTGIAAVLVNGYTIHALTYLNVGGGGKDDSYSELSPEKKKAVEEIWRRVRYLVIDEVSMISATQLTYISRRLKEARSNVPGGDRPFGGINIIATGDFGQLEPVGGRALFHTSLVNRLDDNAGMTDRKQFALHGAYLWRLFDTVVELKKIVRQQDDPSYGEMLSRIRLGHATTCGPGGVMEGSDYHTISERTLDSIRVSKRESLDKFEDSPIIVGDRVSRDALNLRLVHTKAMHRGIQPVFLCAKDKRSGSKDPLSGPLAKAAILLPPGKVDVMGCIPYFPGMRVMITENLAMCHKAVNGREGVLRKVVVEKGMDEMLHAVCAFVEVEGVGPVYPGLPDDIIPVFPSRTTHKFWSGYAECWVSFVREQIPLMPAYVYTDYKAQGRSLDTVIVDLASTSKPQGRYVMLSRVKTLDGLAVLRPFSSECFSRPLQRYIKNEMNRISGLAILTASRLGEQAEDDTEFADDFGLETGAVRCRAEDAMSVDADVNCTDSANEDSMIDDDAYYSTESDEGESDYEEDYMVVEEEL